jgi:arabinogalactan endo-1,4-beta-galactosidase
MDIVSAVPNGRGLDIFYRDATWTRVPGNGWENQAFFDFDDEPLPALNDFRP